MTAKTF